MTAVDVAERRVAVVDGGVEAGELAHNAALLRRRPGRRRIATIGAGAHIVDEHKGAGVREGAQGDEVGERGVGAVVAVDVHDVAGDVGALVRGKRVDGARAVARDDAEAVGAKERVEARERVALPGRVGLEQVEREHADRVVSHQPDSGGETEIETGLAHGAHERQADNCRMGAPPIAANETVERAIGGTCLVQREAMQEAEQQQFKSVAGQRRALAQCRSHVGAGAAQRADARQNARAISRNCGLGDVAKARQIEFQRGILFEQQSCRCGC